MTERVVVAEDEASMAMAMQMLFTSWGWEVHVAHDGLAAVEMIRDVRPVVAVVDIGLPRLDGLAVARRIRAEGTAPRLVVALSGYGDDAHRERSREAGFDRHLVKPVEPEVLRAMLASVSEQTAPHDSQEYRL